VYEACKAGSVLRRIPSLEVANRRAAGDMRAILWLINGPGNQNKTMQFSVKRERGAINLITSKFQQFWVFRY
jgi:hypothetical protein